MTKDSPVQRRYHIVLVHAAPSPYAEAIYGVEDTQTGDLVAHSGGYRHEMGGVLARIEAGQRRTFIRVDGTRTEHWIAGAHTMVPGLEEES